MDIQLAPARHGGLVATCELHALGFSRAAIAAAVRRGHLWRVRQGWFSAPHLDPILARAARVGGVATCASALAQRGAWVLPDRRLHVAVAPQACQLRSPHDARNRLGSDDAVVHWTLGAQTNRLLRDLPEALLDYAPCAPPELLAASANSLLREHPEFRVVWPSLRDRFPLRTHSFLTSADGICESGTEYVFWIRLRHLHARMRRQVWIPGVGRVDFVVGERLVVEIDGFSHHGDHL